MSPPPRGKATFGTLALGAVALLAVALFASAGAAAAGAPVITNIHPTSGSITGHTRLTIHGENFNMNPTENLVFIGDALVGGFCDVVEYYSSAQRIICITPVLDGRGAFPLSVQTQRGVFAECAVRGSNGCRFTVTHDQTPVATHVRPERLLAPDALTVHGSNFRITDQSPAHLDFEMLFSATDRCNLDSDSFISSSFTCDVAPISPGLHPLQLTFGASGRAEAPRLMAQVVPTIDSIHPEIGSVAGGQEITIEGSGFSLVPAENVVLVHSAPCIPTKASHSAIECVTTPHSDTAHAGGASHDGGDVEPVAMLALHWPTGLESGGISELVGRDFYHSAPRSKIVNEFGVPHFEHCASECATQYTTWFTPNSTGEHIFFISGSGLGELWLSEDEREVPYRRDRASVTFNDRRVATLSRARSSFHNEAGQRSEPVTLTKGRRYWMRAFVKGTSALHLNIRVELPSADGQRVNVTNHFGDLIELAPSSSMPVSVVSSGITAVCGLRCAREAPQFAFSAAATPVVDSVTPTTVVAGTELTFTGKGFTSHGKFGASVTIGGAVCAVTTVSAEVLRCRMTQVTAGTFVPELLFSDFGRAAVTGLTVSAALSIDSVTPSGGSRFGGSRIEITGMGFGRDKAVVSVSVCDTLCAVIEVSNTLVSCTTSFVPTAQNCSVNVHVAASKTSVRFGAFTFAAPEPLPDLTVTHSLTPSEVPISGNVLLEAFVATPGVKFGSASDLTVSLVPATGTAAACDVTYAFDTKFICHVPPHAPGVVAVVIATGAREITIGNITFFESVTRVNHNGFGPNGGNFADIFYDAWEMREENAFAVSIGGRPCAVLEVNRIDSRLRCFADAAIPSVASLPVISSFDFTNGSTTNTFWTSAATRTSAGVILSPGGILMTKRHYDGPLVLRATIRPTAAFDAEASNRNGFCIRLRALAADGSSTNTGYEGYLGHSNGDMGVRIGTWRVGGVPEFNEGAGTSSIGLNPSRDTNLRLEVRHSEVAFYVDGVLVERRDTTSFARGSVGFNAGCQEFVVRSLTIEDLSPTTLSVTRDGIPLRNDRFDVTWLQPSTLALRSLSTSVLIPGETITFDLSSSTSQWALSMFLLPRSSDGISWVPERVDLCQSIGRIEDTNTYTCRIRTGIRGGQFVLRLGHRNGGFLATSPFDVTVVPAITRISPSEIATGGARVALEGSGFPLSADDLRVTVGGAVCVAEHVLATSVSCVVDVASATDSAVVQASAFSQDGSCRISGGCRITVGTQRPTVTSVEPSSVSFVRQRITIRGTDLTRSGRVSIGADSSCTVTWGGSDFMHCELDAGFSEAAGSATMVVFTEHGRAAGTATTEFVTGRLGRVDPSSGGPSTHLRLFGIDFGPSSSGFTAVPGADALRFSGAPHRWTENCAAPAGPVLGLYNVRAQLAKNITGIPTHTAIAIRARVLLVDGWHNSRFFVTVDGTPHWFDRTSFTPIVDTCGGSASDSLLMMELVVPHTAASALVQLHGEGLWGLSSFEALWGGLPAVPTVNSVPCVDVSFRRDEIQCSAPPQSSAVSDAVSVAVNGQSCGEACLFRYASDNAPTISNVFAGAAPSSTSAHTFVTRGSVYASAPDALTRAFVAGVSSSWSTGSASGTRVYAAGEFSGVSFRFQENGVPGRCRAMFGLTSAADTNSVFADIDFALFFDRTGVRVFEFGQNLRWLGEVIPDATFRIACATPACQTIHYFYGSHLVYVSTTLPRFPLRLRATIETPNCGVEGITVSAIPPASTEVPVYVGGAGFGNDPATDVFVNDIKASTIFVSSQLVVASVPAAAVSSIPLRVQVVTPRGGQSGLASLTPTPFVVRRLHSEGSTAGNHMQVVLGAGLSAATVSDCPAHFRSESSISCLTSARTDGVASVAVSTADGSSIVCLGADAECPAYNTSTAFTPSVFGPIVVEHRDASHTLNVTGVSFPAGEFPTLVFGENKCPALEPSTTTSFICRLPRALVAGEFDLAHARFDRVGGSAAVTVRVPLLITDTTPLSRTTSGVFSLYGSGFGSDSSVTSLSLVDATGAAVCSAIARTERRLTCTIAALSDPQEPLTLAVGGLSVAVAHVTISPAPSPQVSAISARAGAPTDLVILTGSHLEQLRSVTIGSVACTLLGPVADSTDSHACRITAPLPEGTHTVSVDPASALSAAATVQSQLAIFDVSPSSVIVYNSSSPIEVTVRASGLATTTGSYGVQIGGHSCTVTHISDTAVTCKLIGPIASAQRAVPVHLYETDGPASTRANAFEYRDPGSVRVTGISPSSGTATGGVAVTLFGQNFSPNFQFNIVEIGGARCLTEGVNTALTQLVCTTSPSPPSTNASVRLSILDLGDAVTEENVTFATILSVSSVSGGTSTAASLNAVISAEGGVPLTINGAGFVASEQLFVTVGGAECAVRNVTSTQIVCDVPPAPRPPVPPRRLQTELQPQLVKDYPARTGGVAHVAVRINSVDADVAAGAVVEYDTTNMAVVSSVTPSGVVRVGTRLTVVGTGFLTSGNEVVLTHVSSKTRELCLVESESTTQIVCVAQAMRKGNTMVNVRNPAYGFAHAQFNCPADHYLMCDGHCLMDVSEVFHGHGECSRADWGRFGCQELVDVVSGDTFCHANGGTDRVNMPMLMDDGFPFNLNCPLYGCEGNDCNTTLSIQGRTTRVSTCGLDPNGFFIDLRAAIDSFSPATSSLAGGQLVTITGVDIQIDPTHPHVEIAIVPYVEMLPGDEHHHHAMDMNHDGNEHVHHAEMQMGLGGHPCTPLHNVGADSIVCETSAAPAGDYTLRVRVMGVEVDCAVCRETNFTYRVAITPVVTGLTASTAPDAPLRLTVVGNGFSSSNDGNSVIVGGSPCSSVSSTASQIVCDAPNLPGSRAEYNIDVHVAGRGFAVVEDNTHRSLQVRPQVLARTPTEASTSGGAIITLSGFGFGVDARVRFGSCGFSETLSVNPGTLVVRAASCSSGDREPRITQDGQTTSTCTVPENHTCAVAFSSSVTPRVTSASVTEGSVVTLTGNFLSSNQSGVAVTFSGHPCVLINYTDSSLACTAPVAALPAGQHTSQLLVQPFGFASGSRASIDRPLVVSSVSATEGSSGGHQRLTIAGDGFGSEAAAVSVTVAGIQCTIDSVTGVELQCLTGSAPANTEGPVLVEVGGVSRNVTGVTYIYRATATITSVEPSRGSTAGGTMLTISGTGLSKTMSVTIAGTTCTQSELEQQMTDAAGGSTLYCTTGAHATMLDPVPVMVADALSGAAAPVPDAEAGMYLYVDLWSRRTTWGNNPPPLEMQSVVITKGQTVLLDMSPPRLHLVLIFEGHLMFDYTKNITLEATYIFANFGRLTVGTWEKPFYNKATIRLYGDRLTPEIPNGGAKVIKMMNGVIDIHGVRRQPTWTRLADTAAAGATTILIRGPVDWQPNEEIVVTATDFEHLHAEQRRITSLSTDSATDVVTITLDRPLRWQHFGRRQCYDNGDGQPPACVDEIAEVMLLTRNVVIEGDKDSWENNIGAQTLMMPMENAPTTYGRITYTEIRDCGQKFALGRYPVHFHGSGLSNFSFIIGNAVHHSMNRAFVLHGIHNVTYEDNVVFDTFGHSVFIESGNEMYNVLRRNVVALTRACTSCLNQDLTPANFWITNPVNYFYDNVAAGAQSYGFWFALFEKATHDDHHGEKPVGHPDDLCPTRMPLGAFEGNTGHSNGNYGLNIKPDWHPTNDVFGCKGNRAEGVVLKGLTSYKNAVHGVNFNANAGSIMLEDLVVADIGTVELEASGIWLELESAANATLGVRNGLFFAFTDNQPFHRRRLRRGINFPRSDNWFTDNVTFVNYVNENWATEPFRRQKRMSLSYEWGWQHSFNRMRFINSPQQILLRFQHHAIIFDQDGSIGGVAGARIVPQTPIFSNFSCVPLPDFRSGWPIVRCAPSYVIRRIGMGSIFDSGSDQLWTIGGRSEVVHNLETKMVVTVPINTVADISWTGFEGANRWRTRFSPRFILPHERMLLNVLYREYRYSVNASFDGRQNFQEEAPLLTDARSVSRWNMDTRVISALFARPTTTIEFQAFRCPPEGCLGPAAPPAVDKPCAPFGESSTWADGSVPSSGDVHITFEDSVCLDSSTPGWPNLRFSSLLVEGRLHFWDDFCGAGDARVDRVVITIERFIHIRGGELLIGNETHLIGNCSVEIVIEEVSFDNMEERTRRNLGPWGSRSFALEFGSLGLHGRHFTPKANLAAVAGAGATTLVLDRPVDWRINDRVGISATTRERIYTHGPDRREESEEGVIGAISTDRRTITLRAPLRFEHHGAPAENINGTIMNPGAEVVSLSRIISIHGGHTDSDVPFDHGWQLNIGCTPAIFEGCAGPDTDSATGFPMSLQRPGLVQIEGVALIDIGQRGRRHGGVEIDGLRGTGERPSYIRGSVVHHSMNVALNLRHTSEAITLNENVVFHVFGEAIRVASSGNAITSNVAIMATIPFGHCSTTYRPTFEACRPGIYRISHGNIVRNNVAASGVGIGFITEGNDCETVELWSGNVARSTRDGLLVMDRPADGHFFWPSKSFRCRRVGGVNSMFVADTGVAIWYAVGDVIVSDVTIVDTSLGVTAVVVDTAIDNGEREPRFELHNARFKSYFEGFNCRNYFYRCRMTKFNNEPWCHVFHGARSPPLIGNVGILETVFVTPEYTGRTLGELYFMWLEPDSYHTMRGKALIDTVYFDGFDGMDGCERKNLAFYQNFVSNDTVHQHIFSNVRWGSNMKNGGEFWARTMYGALPNNHQTHGEPTVWNDYDNPFHGGLWPDAPNKMWFVDRDGTFTRSGLPNTHVLSSQTITRESTWATTGWNGVRDVSAVGPVREGCTFVDTWNAFTCAPQYKFMSLVIHNTARDRLERRPAPLVLCKGDGMIVANGDPICQHGIVDFASGPYMKGAAHRTILQRMSRFRFIVENGGNYTLVYRGTPPASARYILTNWEYLGVDPSEIGIVINTRIWGENAHSRLTVAVDGRREFPVFGYGYPHEFGMSWPGPFDRPGTHYHDRYIEPLFHRNVFSFSVRPLAVLDLAHENIVQVSMSLALPLSTFFHQRDIFVAAFITLMGIPEDTVRFAQIVPGTVRRRSSDDTESPVTHAELEIDGGSGGALSPDEATNLASVVRGVDLAQLGSSVGFEVLSVESSAVLVHIAEPPVRVTEGTAFILAQSNHTVDFDTGVVSQLLAAYVRASGPNDIHASATTRDVFVANVFEQAPNISRLTIQCVFILEEDTAGDNTACVEHIYNGLRTGELAIDGHAFFNISLVMNGAPASNAPSFDSGDGNRQIIVILVVVLGLVVLLGIAVALTIAVRRVCVKAPARSSSKVQPTSESDEGEKAPTHPKDAEVFTPASQNV